MDALIEFDSGRGRIWTQDPSRTPLIPPELAVRLAPAEFALYEWTDYWVRYDGAVWLRVGDTRISPVDAGLFRLRFENQLGLAAVQPFDERGPLSAPMHVEVLSPKFPTIAEHVVFLGALIDDLFARAASLPFTFTAQTARAVVESPHPPTPLFAFYFLLQHAADLRGAWGIVQTKPHRRLTDHPALVPLGEAAEVDADVLLDVLRRPDRWAPARGFPLVERLGGYAPVEVWQRQPFESLDTPENRFVLAFLGDLLLASDRLPSEPWWGRVSPDRQRAVRETAAMLRLATVHPMFADVGRMRRIPASSQVLMRREGYRLFLDLWRHFHQARQPLFADLQRALDVRNIATLYEMWAFFALVDEISLILETRPALELSISDEGGLVWSAVARFSAERDLIYNHDPPSYSVPLRPDFTWREGGKPVVALDAKFRLDRHDIEGEAEDDRRATAVRSDLYKMHAYRDALGVRAAVAVFPGNQAIFYDVRHGNVAEVSLGRLLLDGQSGIGALPMRPADPRLRSG